ncbi:hypothetical protein [Paenibacillus sp. RC67]|uniref:hypothetical protein n=1 Tax=Paenibacillus sp. RC67 TaxID=3039392 RepID=UPI0024ADC4E3|nr:hypothetical protein [Paenibacillus sp. RC67]
MRKFILGLLFGLCLSLGSVVYASDSIQSMLVSMASSVNYDDSSNRISIKQSSAKFDKDLANPIPFVYYERNYEGGTVWIQEILLVQGSSCWYGCADAVKPYSALLKKFEYPPVEVVPGSSILVQYPKGMEPKSIKITRVIAEGSQNDIMYDRDEDMLFENEKILLPKEAGIYNLWIKSWWDSGDTSYFFAVEIK